MTDDENIRYLIKRLAMHQESASELDYGRIEELCHLILKEMTPDRAAQDRFYHGGTPVDHIWRFGRFGE